MVEDGIMGTVSNGTTIIKMLIEPWTVKRLSAAITQSLTESEKIVDSITEPACISTERYFVCNDAYYQLLKQYGCPQSSFGMRQLDNIRNIISNAEVDTSKIDEKLIDYDVIMKIFDEIKFVSEDVLVKAWSKLLKEEVENNRRFSKRTVVLLSQLSSDEARLFHKNVKSIIRDSNGVFFYLSNPGIKGIDLLERTTLIEVGFIGSESLTINDGSYFWNDYYIKSKGKTHVFKLTQFGVDIYQLMDNDYTLDDCVDVLNLQYLVKSYSIFQALNDNEYMASPLRSKGEIVDYEVLELNNESSQRGPDDSHRGF